MGALMIISLGFMLMAGFPVMTYLYAKQKGRNAKSWLLIGILLPGITTLILSLLPVKSNGKQS
jgi:hypothetical protein